MGLSLLRVNWRLLTEMDEAGYLERMEQAKCGCECQTCKERIFLSLTKWTDY